MDIFASTSCLWNKDLDSGVPALFEAGFDGVELSASSWDPEILQKISRWRALGPLSIHNYFPRPQEDFVFNLASEDPEVSSRSLDHARWAIDIAHDHDMKWVSFHSGFLIDPQPDELGRAITPRKLSDRKQALDTFTQHAIAIAERAATRGVNVLWENNVLSPANLEAFKANPLLLVEPEEMLTFASHMPQNSGLLLDVAHLSVSCNSLRTDKISALLELSPGIRGAHLSEDNGTIDDGSLVTPHSWFWEHLPKSIEYCVIESHFSHGDVAKEQSHIAHNRLAQADDESFVPFPHEPETHNG